MARRDLDAPVTLSVLDRLIDTEPKKREAERSLSRAESLQQLKESLRRDLEWLLNTRRNPDLDEGVWREAERSVYGYGVPDITSFSISSVRDQHRLRRSLENAIMVFEPRISGPRVRMESAAGPAKGLRFHIQGLLRIDPAPEPILFDTVLQLPAGQYEVRSR